MKNVTRHTGVLKVIERDKNNGHNGNPRYVVTLDGTTCRTAIDSSLGYAITNFDGKEVTASIGTHYGTVTIEDVSEALPTYRITKSTGETYITSMAIGVTLDDAAKYFMKNTFVDVVDGKEVQWRATKVEKV